METGETQSANLSRCCAKIKIVADIFLWVKRQPPYEGNGRRKIAESVMCSFCLKSIGDLRKEDNCPPEFDSMLWYQMQKKTGGDKFYCEYDEKGKLVPFGGQVQVGAK